ncbi:hypothetical protein Glove_139g15 [Diversispora epigaea]|uniref:Uncharacterized protein n=1 Tax=Diversispora epigaea TaxID=1348612 RepID=A0A397J4Y9_9GLOM|nr:hypothetical protein Glove_139g15 [Diversispora epigaea]
MSSVFISFCFIKTVTGNDKYVTGSALYRVKGDEDKFREIIYKGFTGTSETLIMDFEKDSIVLVIGRYVYEENVEYVTLIQTVPISYSSDDSTNTQEDLPYSSPLLIYSAPALTNSYKSNDEIGRHSFLMSKKLYNGVTGKKNVESNIIISYTNPNGRYNSLKDNLKKTVMSVIGRFKIGSHKRPPHIMASDIEWNYAGNIGESQSLHSSNKGKTKPHEDLDNQLDIIDEKYAKMNSESLKKRKLNNFIPKSKSSQDSTSSTNLNDVILQIRDGETTTQENSDVTIDPPEMNPN